MEIDMSFRKGQKIQYKHGKGMAQGRVKGYDSKTQKVTIETKTGKEVTRPAANVSVAVSSTPKKKAAKKTKVSQKEEVPASINVDDEEDHVAVENSL